MTSKLLSVIGFLIFIYVTLVAVIYLGQSRLVYFPTSSIDATPDLINLTYEDVWLQTEDGDRIHGWYLPREKAKWTVLMFHGNGGNISHRLQTLDLLNKIGVNTLIIDYRGYGRSQGQPSEQATYQDALAAWQHLIQNRTDPESVILFGRSLGGAVAVWLATKVNPKGLILESTFSSVVDMAEHHYPFLPVSYISRFKYDSLSLASKIEIPTLVLHSREDNIVPFDLGFKLYEALPGNKSFIEMQGGHNDGFFVSGEHYINAIKNFIESL